MRLERSVTTLQMYMYKNLRPAAQEPGVYDVVGVWAAGVGVEAASGSGLGAGVWLIAVDARANDGHGAHCRGRACLARSSQVAEVHDYIISGVLNSKVVFVTLLSPSRLSIPRGLENAAMIIFQMLAVPSSGHTAKWGYTKFNQSGLYGNQALPRNFYAIISPFWKRSFC